MEHIMIDIETLSTQPNAAILSIAAVRFDLSTGKCGDKLYMRIDAASNAELGREIDPDTVYWWLYQEPEAIAEAIAHSHRLPLPEALQKLGEFIFKNEDELVPKIWANSPSFDLIILKDAYESIGEEAPWRFWQERDVRTIASLNGFLKNSIANEAPHHPLADCTHQIAYISKIYQLINLTSGKGFRMLN